MPTRSRWRRAEALAWGVRHWAEAIARDALLARGWRLVDANAVVRGGELDLVMRQGRTLVFVEVRQRRTARYGDAAESLTATKRHRLRRAARAWTRARYGRLDLPMRIDAVLVHGVASSFVLEHLEDVA